MSLALTGQPFTATESTHTRHIWTLESQTVEFSDGQKETREILLWDMAGRILTDQLSLHEVTVALIVCDAFNEVESFAGVYHWARTLQQVERIQRSTASGIRKFLVMARMDRGGVGVSKRRINALVRELGFDDYFETSAREGWHIAELTGAIRSAIDWDSLPCIRSIEMFQLVKDFLLWEKNIGCSLATMNELYSMFLEFLENKGNTLSLKGLHTGLKTAIDLIESQGLLITLGNSVLLQPEFLDFYSLALFNLARNDPDELGSIAEERVHAGDLQLPKDERLTDKEQERIFLTALIEDLLQSEMVLREQSDDGTFLIFPSFTTRERLEMLEPEGKTVVFTFEGLAQNIYITLAVRLAHSHLFRQREQWRNAVTYTARTGGTFGIFLHIQDERRSELTLFFDRKASEQTRFHFEEYVRTHLERRIAQETLQRRRVFVCPACGTSQSDQQVIRRKERGFTWINCSVCDTRISILDREQQLSATPSSVVVETKRPDSAQRERMTADSIIRDKTAVQDFDVFLCHNSQDKAEVREIGKRLKDLGILPWLDEWELRPGLPWQYILEEQIDMIKSVAVFVGQDGIGPWHQQELDALLREFVSRACPVIPVLLPSVPRRPTLPVFLKGMTWVDFRLLEPDPMQRLAWGITGNPNVFGDSSSPLFAQQTQRSVGTRFQLSNRPDLSSIPSSADADALWDINDIRLVIGDKSFRNYRRLARTLFQRIGIPDTDYTMIETPHLAFGSAWEVTLPKLGLRLNTQRALVLLRQTELGSICYEDLKREHEMTPLLSLWISQKFPRYLLKPTTTYFGFHPTL